MTLDLTKPMRWKNGKTVTVVHHGKAGAALKTEGAQWPHWYTPTELDELFENIPEPPIGPEEVWAYVNPRLGFMWASPHNFVQEHDKRDDSEMVRYLRADLAARKVKPLTDDELAMLRDEDHGHSFHDDFKDIMAARGIEVGE